MSTIEQAIAQLHDRYVELVNIAVAEDDLARAEQLAADFDIEVLDTVRQRLAAAA